MTRIVRVTRKSTIPLIAAGLEIDLLLSEYRAGRWAMICPIARNAEPQTPRKNEFIVEVKRRDFCPGAFLSDKRSNLI